MISSLLDKTNTFRIFSGYPVIASFSDRNLDLGFGCPEHEKNRSEFTESIGITYRNLVCAKQAHGENIREVEEKDRANVMLNTDAFITKSKNTAIAVFTADCLSVFLYDRKVKAIGLVHAGWRGTKDKILYKTVRLMAERFGSKPKDLLCAFGPAIRSCCYEVGPDMGRYFTNKLVNRQGKLYLDLAALNKEDLFAAGLSDKQLEDCNICTSSSPDKYFSYRREKEKSGRMMSVMMLK